MRQIKPILNKREPRIPFTKKGYDEIVQEKTQLLGERPDAVEHLRKAREMGDLRENGYYKAARQRLSFIDARIRRVDRLIKLAIITESKQTGFVDIGSTVRISKDGIEQTFTIVGGYESNPQEHTISYISPLGKALMGKKERDSVTVSAPNGVTTYIITHISQ